jgi:hypothetical protein
VAVRESHRLKMFENRMLRIIFEFKIVEIIGNQRKLPDEERHNLQSLPSIIRMITSRRLSWKGHVA